MAKATMENLYRKFSMADTYIIGFIVKGLLYMVSMDEIPSEYLKVEKASRNQGENLRLRIASAYRKSLVASAICLGTADLLTATAYNKGENFEKVVTEYYGQTWKKDNAPFYKDGDITVDGLKIQIKLDSATLTNSKQLEKLTREF